MDPDAALERLRALIGEIGAQDGRSIDDLLEIAELADHLDGWLSKGGFLPSAWAR